MVKMFLALRLVNQKAAATCCCAMCVATARRGSESSSNGGSKARHCSAIMIHDASYAGPSERGN